MTFASVFDASRLLKSVDGAQDERLRNSLMCAIPLMVSPSNHQSPRSSWLMAYSV
jgi:hypothetical protein